MSTMFIRQTTRENNLQIDDTEFFFEIIILVDFIHLWHVGCNSIREGLRK